MTKQLVSILVGLFFLATSVIGPDAVRAEGGLPVPGTMVMPTPAFAPVMIKGLKVHPENPLLFDFIVDAGQSGLTADDAAFKSESERLVKYFLAALAVKEKDLWVNLSPYEKGRIIADDLGQTALGADMLAQDYVLKQLTASMIYPEGDLGKEFWQNVYRQAQERFGTTDIPVDTFNKVWVAADKAKVLERDGMAYVLGGHLKVMLETDYVAMSHQRDMAESSAPAGDVALDGQRDMAESSAPAGDLAEQIIRDIIIPAIEKEVNEGKNFSRLRQMFYATVLAAWYKSAIKDAFLNQVYSDKGKTKGVLSDDLQAKNKIYAQYLAAYKKGVFDYIKEDVDAVTQQPVPRRYFSGGIQFNASVDYAQKITPWEAEDIARNKLLEVSVFVDLLQQVLEAKELVVARDKNLLDALVLPEKDLFPDSVIDSGFPELGDSVKRFELKPGVVQMFKTGWMGSDTFKVKEVSMWVDARSRNLIVWAAGAQKEVVVGKNKSHLFLLDGKQGSHRIKIAWDGRQAGVRKAGASEVLFLKRSLSFVDPVSEFGLTSPELVVSYGDSVEKVLIDDNFWHKKGTLRLSLGEAYVWVEPYQHVGVGRSVRVSALMQHNRSSRQEISVRLRDLDNIGQGLRLLREIRQMDDMRRGIAANRNAGVFLDDVRSTLRQQMLSFLVKAVRDDGVRDVQALEVLANYFQEEADVAKPLRQGNEWMRQARSGETALLSASLTKPQRKKLNNCIVVLKSQALQVFFKVLQQKNPTWSLASSQGKDSRDYSMKAPGGIDLDAGKMTLDVAREGGGVRMKVDASLMERFRQGQFSGARGIILGITPLDAQVFSNSMPL